MKTPIPGMLEAAVDGQVYYITGDGRYILGGPLLDVRANRDLTEARLEKISAIAFDSLPLDRAIKHVKGSGARKMAIFEDPDCPYCKTLEQALTGIDNVTVYVFLCPIDQIHPDAAQKSKADWCAKDPAQAWNDIMRTSAVPARRTVTTRWRRLPPSPGSTASRARRRRFSRTDSDWSGQSLKPSWRSSCSGPRGPERT